MEALWPNKGISREETAHWYSDKDLVLGTTSITVKHTAAGGQSPIRIQIMAQNGVWSFFGSKNGLGQYRTKNIWSNIGKTNPIFWPKTAPPQCFEPAPNPSMA